MKRFSHFRFDIFKEEEKKNNDLVKSYFNGQYMYVRWGFGLAWPLGYFQYSIALDRTELLFPCSI